MNSAPRPLHQRWWFWLLVVLLGVAAVAMIVVRRPGAVAQRLAAIRAQGLPAEWREVEQFYPAVPPDENGAPALLAAIGQIRYDSTYKLPRRDEAWTDETRAWAARQAEQNADAVAALHDTLQRTKWRYPLNFQGNPAMLLLNHLSPHKQAAQLLQFQAIHAATRNDPAGAARAIHDNLRLARTLDGEPILISYLVRVAEVAIAAGALEQVLGRVALDEGQLAGLQAAFADAASTNTLFRALAGERAFGSSFFTLPPRELVQTLGVAGGAPAPAPSAADLLQSSLYTVYSVSGLRSSDHRFYLDRMEEILAAVARPPGPEMRKAMDAFDQAVGQSKRNLGRLLSGMVLPALSKTCAKELRSAATVRCVVTACAVERFRLAQGRLPAALDELVPRFLPAVPADPMDSQPLKYRPLDRGYVVYSLGEDDTDDGGREFANRPKNPPGGWDYTFTVAR